MNHKNLIATLVAATGLIVANCALAGAVTGVANGTVSINGTIGSQTCVAAGSDGAGNQTITLAPVPTSHFVDSTGKVLTGHAEGATPFTITLTGCAALQQVHVWLTYNRLGVGGFAGNLLPNTSNTTPIGTATIGAGGGVNMALFTDSAYTQYIGWSATDANLGKGTYPGLGGTVSNTYYVGYQANGGAVIAGPVTGVATYNVVYN